MRNDLLILWLVPLGYCYHVLFQLIQFHEPCFLEDGISFRVRSGLPSLHFPSMINYLKVLISYVQNYCLSTFIKPKLFYFQPLHKNLLSFYFSKYNSKITDNPQINTLKPLILLSYYLFSKLKHLLKLRFSHITQQPIRICFKIVQYTCCHTWRCCHCCVYEHLSWNVYDLFFGWGFLYDFYWWFSYWGYWVQYFRDDLQSLVVVL